MDIEHALQEAASQDSEPVIDHAALQRRGNRARRRTRLRPVAASVALVVAVAAGATWLTGATRQSNVVVAPSQQDASEGQVQDAPAASPVATTNLKIYASNQSFDDQEVRLVVTLDGEEVIDGVLVTGSQHNLFWVELPVPHGEHDVVAEVVGRGIESSIRIDAEATPYLLYQYWGPDEDGGDSGPLKISPRKEQPEFG